MKNTGRIYTCSQCPMTDKLQKQITCIIVSMLVIEIYITLQFLYAKQNIKCLVKIS